jgi:hypothetical protein
MAVYPDFIFIRILQHKAPHQVRCVTIRHVYGYKYVYFLYVQVTVHRDKLRIK